MLRIAALLLLAVLLVGAAGCQNEAARRSEAQTAPLHTANPGTADHGAVELANRMSHMQRWTHKLLLSVDAENEAAAAFYFHELEETAERIAEEVPTYEGHQIDSLTTAMLIPSLDSLGAGLDRTDWRAVNEHLHAVVKACNQCHDATEHGFLQITAAPEPNPYLQDFRPSE